MIPTRYRQVPTFGKDVIRKFSSNTSEMKRLAARDYEDILQVVMMSYSQLLPLTPSFSVLYLCLKDSFLNPIMKP